MGGEATGLAARMLEQLGRAVVGADTEFRVVYWNRAAEDMFGWSPDEVLDRNILEATGTELDPTAAWSCWSSWRRARLSPKRSGWAHVTGGGSPYLQA